MRCPTCGNEMEPGYIQCGSKMAWVKSLHKVSLLPKEGEVLLGNNVFLGLSFGNALEKVADQQIQLTLPDGLVGEW